MLRGRCWGRLWLSNLGIDSFLVVFNLGFSMVSYIPLCIIGIGSVGLWLLEDYSLGYRALVEHNRYRELLMELGPIGPL